MQQVLLEMGKSRDQVGRKANRGVFHLGNPDGLHNHLELSSRPLEFQLDQLHVLISSKNTGFIENIVLGVS